MSSRRDGLEGVVRPGLGVHLRSLRFTEFLVPDDPLPILGSSLAEGNQIQRLGKGQALIIEDAKRASKVAQSRHSSAAAQDSAIARTRSMRRWTNKGAIFRNTGEESEPRARHAIFRCGGTNGSTLASWISFANWPGLWEKAFQDRYFVLNLEMHEDRGVS
jgi:hypothetical protein